MPYYLISEYSGCIVNDNFYGEKQSKGYVFKQITFELIAGKIWWRRYQTGLTKTQVQIPTLIGLEWVWNSFFKILQLTYFILLWK